MKKIVFTGFAFFSIANAHPLLNINVDDYEFYEKLESAKNSNKLILSIKPISNIFSSEKGGWYIKPINNITTKIYYTNADNLLLEGQSGISLKKGLNAFFYEDGYISFGKNLVSYYQLRQDLNKDTKQGNLFRGYIKYKIGKFSIEAGRDNVNWGPGEYGLILSNNTYPFPLIKLDTEQPLKFWGKWRFTILNGWLQEKRKDFSNPKLLGLRVVWKPADWIELGGSKTTMYGGDGRPSYKLTDYPELIFSSRDNIPGDKFDNDSRAAYDISIFLPFKSFNIFKIYYVEAGDDIHAIWQKEDRGKLVGRFPFIFMLLDPLYQAGVLISKNNHSLRVEYVKTDYRSYIHHWYNYEGYTYKGFSLGYPYGRDVESFLIKYIYDSKKNYRIKTQLGYYKQPVKTGDIKSKTYYGFVEFSYLLRKNIEISPYFRIDKKDNIDENPLPTQFDITNKNKTFITVGLSASINF
ncbi:capsule assembly Wzi family protein [Hydrogenothermus marinus]|uniref:Capsule assembly protein Wzi n=1 Tax=Hydrogenothermus marinus TaxID=133270 RepID=A0A3M0BQX9_9AQUI|nr:capsule assembly Wzi family protein [Hydrogenothermus marinus]RMA93332.1 capsule assembly protein Wzi [Hydrogenothermus marinus]